MIFKYKNIKLLMLGVIKL